MIKFIHKSVRIPVILWLALLAACASDAPEADNADRVPLQITIEADNSETDEAEEAAQAPPPNDTQLVEAESNRDGVFTIAIDGNRVALPAPDEIFLEVGAGIDVDETGRAILRFADLLTVEVLRDGELTIQQINIDDQAAVVSVLQNGGALLNDFDPGEQIERRFTIETEFATITATGTRFLLASEANSPLEWIVALEATEEDLQITADGVTKSVPAGMARWVAPVGEPSAGIEAQMGNVDAWLAQVQNGAAVAEVGEVVWQPADVLANTGRLTAVPPPGETFNLDTAVELTLENTGGHYWLEDCNGDGLTDIAMQNGRIHMDFRPVSGRTRALDVTITNRTDSYGGDLQLLDPAQDSLATQTITALPGDGEIISLRTEAPFHYANLALTDGCFLGFSLTPPEANGEPGLPRPAINPEDLNANGRPPSNGRLIAWPVGGNGYDTTITIDGETGDWSLLDELIGPQAGAGWVPFDDVVFDTGCSYTASDFGTDLFGQVRFAYDAQYLYAAFLVNDEFFKGYDGRDQAFFLGDSPQLLLDLDLYNDFSDTKNSADDIQLDFHPGFGQAGALAVPPAAALWRLHTSPPTSTVLRNALVAAIPIETANGPGYFLETAVPWSVLGVNPQPEQQYGLAASISDDDTADGNDQECMISTAPNRDWQDPTTWGTLLLASWP